MTPVEFERVAARLAELEDWVQEMSRFYARQRGMDDVRQAFDKVLRLAIAAHGQLQLELQHSELAAEVEEWR